jgi:NADH dehydrogenase
LPGGVETVTGDLTNFESLVEATQGVTAVMHLAAVVANLKQTKTTNYRAVNDLGTANLVRAAKRSDVSHFVHLGGINTVPGAPGSYIRTRHNGESHVKVGGVPYTIVQPSILFGAGAQFFVALAGLARRAPVIPVPGNGRLRFQPIWVEDVVTCLTAILGEGGRDETIAVGGPAYYTYDQLLDLVCTTVGKRRLKLHVPLRLVTPGTAVMERLLPHPPVTTAALELFEGPDNITDLDSVQSRFGFQPRRLEETLRAEGL